MIYKELRPQLNEILLREKVLSNIDFAMDNGHNYMKYYSGKRSLVIYSLLWTTAMIR